MPFVHQDSTNKYQDCSCRKLEMRLFQEIVPDGTNQTRKAFSLEKLKMMQYRWRNQDWDDNDDDEDDDDVKELLEYWWTRQNQSVDQLCFFVNWTRDHEIQCSHFFPNFVIFHH